MSTFADRVIEFNRNLGHPGDLPEGIQVMNPFDENPEILEITRQFYTKYYDDQRKRKMILGINPGRFGAGTTGIPFTDTKRLSEVCGIQMPSANTHEPSSVFIYEMIAEYGGPRQFYRDYYINSISPLGFLRLNNKGNRVNCNYYDDEKLYQALEPFLISSLKKQMAFGVETEHVYVLGKKNARYLERINQKASLFGSMTVLDHPRYIVQYKARQKEAYLKDYLAVLKG